MAPEGSLFPPEGQYVVGYVSDSGMARLTNIARQQQHPALDVEGTPSFDLPDTEAYEGDEIDVKTSSHARSRSIGRPCQGQRAKRAR